MRRMRTLVFGLLAASFAASAHAQIVTESWLRQAGISCGGGLAMELQGEIDAAVIRRLRIGHVEADGTYKRSETETLLKQFQSEEKRQAYVDYVNCLINLMNLATATSQLPPREVVLESAVSIAPLETVRRGQRFVMTPGDAVAIKDHSSILTINSVAESGKRGLVYFSWSNSETGKSVSNTYAYQAQLIDLGERCALVPYKIDVDKDQVSLLSNC